MRRHAFVLIAGLAALAVSGCGGSNSTGSGSKTTAAAPTTTGHAAGHGSSGATAVTIKTFAYKPNPLKISVGTTVKWTNQDEILHTVTSGTRDKPDGQFDGKLDSVGSTFEHTFEKAGTFMYVCTIHPGMDGEVDVS